MKKNTKLSNAVKTLISALKEDVECRTLWQSHIAKSFRDEVAKYERGGVYPMDKIANQAADNFIKSLTMDNPPSIK